MKRYRVSCAECGQWRWYAIGWLSRRWLDRHPDRCPVEMPDAAVVITHTKHAEGWAGEDDGSKYGTLGEPPQRMGGPA